MKTIILVAALLAFSAPAFAGGSHGNGGTIGGTSANSASGAAVQNCGCIPGGALAHGGNESWAVASVAPGAQRSSTGSYSSGSGWSGGSGSFKAFGEGQGGAYTHGKF